MKISTYSTMNPDPSEDYKELTRPFLMFEGLSSYDLPNKLCSNGKTGRGDGKTFWTLLIYKMEFIV